MTEPSHESDEVPLHPDVLHWLRAYTTADDVTRDAVVADILDALNAHLLSEEASRGVSKRLVGTAGTALDVTAWRDAEEGRLVQRERPARLDGLLFAARDLTGQLDHALVVPRGALNQLQPRPDLAPAVRELIQTAVSGLSVAADCVGRLRRIIGAGEDQCMRLRASGSGGSPHDDEGRAGELP